MKSNKYKTKEQLVSELEEMRQRLAELEKTESERQQVEEQVRISEERLRSITENSSDHIMLVGQDLKIQFINKTVPDLKKEDVIGKSINDFVPKGFQKLAYDKIQSVFKTGKPTNYQTEYLTAEGDTHYFDVRLSPITREGKVVSVVSSSNNVTEHKQTEEKLRESEEKLQRVFESASDGIVVTDLNGNIMEMNEAAVRLHGSDSKEKLIGQNTIELIAEKDRVRVMGILKSAKEDGQIRRNVEITFLTKDGREYLAEVSSALLRDAAGNSAGFIAIFKDITERKQAEQQLKESESFLNSIIEQSPFSTWISDDKGTNIRQNQACRELFGIKRDEEVIGKYNLYKDEEVRKQGFMPLIEDVFSKGKTVNFVIDYDFQKVKHVKVPGATHIILDVTIFPIKDADGKVTNAVVQHKDITERKQAEEKIQQQTEFLNSVLKSLTHPFYVIDANDYTVKMVNPVAKLGKLSEKSTCYALAHKRDKPCEGAGHVCPLQEVKKTRKPVVVEHIHYDEDGNVRNAEVHGYPIFDSEGNVIQMIEYILDITERKQAEEKARELETLKEVDRLRSGLLANVSHELRTPLTSIKGFATTLLRSDVHWSEEEQRDFLQSIDEETERLIRLISDLLDMSCIEAGGLKLEKHNYQIAEVLDSVNSRLASLTEHHQLQVIVPSELPPVFVDQMRIGQVLSNLVENAAKFSGEGTQITIEAQLAGDNINISVTDRGQGIPAELLDNVFDRFYQAESIVTGRKSGTGLGLSICRGILEGHGGKIWVESKVGKGSKFSFDLPVSKGGEETA